MKYKISLTKWTKVSKSETFKLKQLLESTLTNTLKSRASLNADQTPYNLALENEIVLLKVKHQFNLKF